MSPRINIDTTGEVIKAPVVPAGWYHVRVMETPTVKAGKASGKKYLYWVLQIASGLHKGILLSTNTTLDRGDDPTKSKRFMFHQAIAACGIEKVNDKYSFDLDELKDKEFYVFVTVKEESYNNNLFEKNEIKKIAKEMPIPEPPMSAEVGSDDSPLPF